MKTLIRRRTDSQTGYHSNQQQQQHYNNNNIVSSIHATLDQSVTDSLTKSGSKFRSDKGEIRNRAQKWILYCIPFVACVVSYYNALTGDFVHDDVFAIRENRDVVGEEWSWYRLLTDDFWGAPLKMNNSHKSYRPLCTLTYRLNYLVSRLDPRPYHFVNLVLHIVCTLLVCYICVNIIFKTATKSAYNIQNRKTFAATNGNAFDRVNGHLRNHTDKGNGNYCAAMASALLFAVHPVHTEAVTGLVGRADVLACKFLLLSFITHHRTISATSHGDRHLGLYLLSIVMATAAMFSKEHGVMALVINSADDVISAVQDDKQRKSRFRWWRCRYRVFGNAFTFLALFYLRWTLMGSQLPLFNEMDNPAAFSSSLLTRYLTFLYLPVFNTYLLLYPRKLSYDWQYDSIPLLTALKDKRLYSLVLFYGLITVLLWKALRHLKERSLLPLQYGLLMLCVPFIPATNLFFPVGFVVAERVLYIPSIGYCILVGYGLRSFTITTARRRCVCFLVALVVIIMMGRTIDRNLVWRTRESLFRSGVETLPNNAKMHYNYGNYLRDANRTSDAVHHYREAIRLYSKFASAYNNLGLLVNDPIESEACYRKTIKFNPKHANAHLNLGVMYINSGQRFQGLTLLEKAAELNPRYSVHLANAYISVGKDQLSLNTLRNAVVKHNVRDPETLRLLAQQLVRAGLFDEAEAYVDETNKNKNDLVETVVDKALILHNTNRHEAAIAMIEKASDKASNAEELKELSRFYQRIDQHDRALVQLEKGLGIDPDNLPMMHAKAASLSILEKYDEAEELFKKIMSMDEEDYEVLRGLSSMYGVQKRHEEGLVVINRSVQILESQLPGMEVELVKALNMKASHERDMQHFDDAARTYQRLLELDGDNVHARINLGAILHLKGSLEDARVHYIAALRLSPENKVLKENLKKLDRILQRKLSN